MVGTRSQDSSKQHFMSFMANEEPGGQHVTRVAHQRMVKEAGLKLARKRVLTDRVMSQGSRSHAQPAKLRTGLTDLIDLSSLNLSNTYFRAEGHKDLPIEEHARALEVYVGKFSTGVSVDIANKKERLAARRDIRLGDRFVTIGVCKGRWPFGKKVILTYRVWSADEAKAMAVRAVASRLPPIEDAAHSKSYQTTKEPVPERSQSPTPSKALTKETDLSQEGKLGPDIERLINEVKNEHRQAEGFAVNFFERAFNIGTKLLVIQAAIKKTFGHGYWMVWCAPNLDFSIDTAQRYMRTARKYAGKDISKIKPASICEALAGEGPGDAKNGRLSLADKLPRGQRALDRAMAHLKADEEKLGPEQTLQETEGFAAYRRQLELKVAERKNTIDVGGQVKPDEPKSAEPESNVKSKTASVQFLPEPCTAWVARDPHKGIELDTIAATKEASALALAFRVKRNLEDLLADGYEIGRCSITYASVHESEPKADPAPPGPGKPQAVVPATDERLALTVEDAQSNPTGPKKDSRPNVAP